MEEVIIKQVELKKDIASAINKAHLPAFIVTPILKDLLEQFSLLEVNQYNKALMNKEKTKKEEADKKKATKGGN